MLYETTLGRKLFEAMRAKRHTLAGAARTMGISLDMFKWARRYGVADHPHTQRFWHAIADYLGVSVTEAQALARQRELPETPPPPPPKRKRQEPQKLAAPRVTFVGTQYYAPISKSATIGCATCAVAATCSDVVFTQDGFALCEQIIPVDTCLPDPERITGGYRNASGD